MKVSLRWIFDHLNAQWTDYRVEDIVARFNLTTAEIEHTEKVSLSLDDYALCVIEKITETQIEYFCAEWAIKGMLPIRTDASVNNVYLIKKYKNDYAWATLTDWNNASREGLMPTLFIPDQTMLSGLWKKNCEIEDYILEIDNKSITNRPDLWGHRGVAREIGALLSIPLKKIDDSGVSVVHYESKSTSDEKMPILISLETSFCSRLSAAMIKDIRYTPSTLFMALRLNRVDQKPMNILVDATNYVMCDIGHPMHAFDGRYFENSSLKVRMAKSGEILTSLDGVDLTLTSDDIVISNEEKVASLAGIKGGALSGVASDVSSLIIEAGCFDAGTIRLSAAYHKLRTDASARFEKSLDPEQTVVALQRYIKLLRDAGLSCNISSIATIGNVVEPLKITVKHNEIIDRLGVNIESATVKKLLGSIECIVDASQDSNPTYTVTVPTFRCTKDIRIKEDLVEEVGRLYGYNTIPAQLPSLTLQPEDYVDVQRLSALKHYYASGQVAFSEVQNYALFDNDFLHKIGWEIDEVLTLKNPLNAQATTLVTSLIPHLLKNVELNSANQDELRFFEAAKIWHASNNSINEQSCLSGVWFKKHETVDFYQAKMWIQGMFDRLQIPVVWKKSDKKFQWAHAFQAADLFIEERCIGTVAVGSLAMMARCVQGSTLLFELNLDAILNYKVIDPVFKPLPLYQATHLDMSIMVPLFVTVSSLEETIKNVDKRIFEVYFIDQFKKPEWTDKKSITLRFGVRDEQKTITKELIDSIMAEVIKNLEKQYGVQVR